MTGWIVICPDGAERHFPYINKGDAECDAECYTDSDPPCAGCPGGKHTVVPKPGYEPPKFEQSLS